MSRFVILVLIAMLVAAPALIVRTAGWHVPPMLAAGLFGAAILAGGFLLNWGAETAERHVSQGLMIVVLALITVLPEYAVDIYYAFQAGRNPQSSYVHYATANMTGANRLLIGVAWPLVVAVHWWRTRERAIVLTSLNTVEIGFLTLASLYAFVVLLKSRIDRIDFFILLGIFGAYLWVASRLPKGDASESEDEEPGPAQALATLTPVLQWTWIVVLTLVAAFVIFASAEPFAESILASGRLLGLNEYLLIQWLAPLASEAPTVTIVVLFVLAGRAAGGLTAMISDKINQWTLLVGMLPLAMSIGAGSLTALPLDARQHEEFFLTAAQSLFGISLLIRLRLTVASALTLGSMFLLQIAIAFTFRNDAHRTIVWLTIFGWVYIALAVPRFLIGAPTLFRIVCAQLGIARWRDLRKVTKSSTPH